MQGRTTTTVLLGVAQTLAWASSYYLPAILADAIARDVGTSSSAVFGAFSVALLMSAAIGPFAGRLIDRRGGRPVLIASNVVFAAGLAALSQAQQPLHVLAAWAVMGLAMGSGLYEAAFATAVRLHGQQARRTITGITLFAGFASTVGWPLTAWLESTMGWRGACLVWAGLHLVIGLPLNAMLPAAERAAHAPSDAIGKPEQQAALSPDKQRGAAVLLAFVFAVAWFTSTAMAAHLPKLLLGVGASLAAAVGIAALVGPAQVAGRLIEFAFLSRAHPLLSARLATLGHPLGALCIGLFGSSAAMAFALLHGLGNGILTIAIGTLPLLFFGAKGYGQRQGFLMVPARIVQAGAPFLFGLAVERLGVGALWISAVLGLVACLALTRLAIDLRR
ncbi:MFS transporter [Pseudorhodoferax aquiterrae]|uniref:MFS transporter n=3 Tax=Comamonadaceae TaxID=80864 RepID=A0A2P1NMC9_9BURK|nr:MULTISPECIES: MFS transporter [Comamonadaceae]AVP58167.1 MFS transporter [Pulveribacter suum]MDA7418052.1 MFS transporter [Xenophilus arseniciresistens]GHC90233.1 MFS transporter [Pseudorhodoferax aquiterrae]